MRTNGLIAAGVLTATLVVGMAVPAQADDVDETCEVGIVLPSTIAITGYVTNYGVRLTGDLECFDFVTCDLSEGLISTGSTISFFRPNTSGFIGYMGLPSKVHALPRQGAYSFTQFTDPATGAKRPIAVVESASNTMVAKYDSRVAWRKPHVDGKVVHLLAAASSVNDSTRIFGNYMPWAKAKVRFQIKRAGRWKTVATAKTDATGIAHADAKAEKGQWRVITVDSKTTWGRTSTSHRI